MTFGLLRFILAISHFLQHRRHNYSLGGCFDDGLRRLVYDLIDVLLDLSGDIARVGCVLCFVFAKYRWWDVGCHLCATNL